MAIKIDLNSIVKNLQDRIQVVSSAFREKGFKPFSRALIVGLAFILAPYIAVYSPSRNKLGLVKEKIKDAETKANFADSYNSLRDSLGALYTRLPSGPQKEQWLSDAVLNALKAENITPDSVRPPDDEKHGALLIQKVDFSAPMKYSQLIELSNRLEHMKPKLEITAIDLKKINEQIGINEVEMNVTTVIPIKRLLP